MSLFEAKCACEVSLTVSVLSRSCAKVLLDALVKAPRTKRDEVMATLSEMNPRVNIAPAVAPAAVEPGRSSASARWKDFLALVSKWSTALVLAVLAGLAVWGHHSGWKLP